MERIRYNIALFIVMLAIGGVSLTSCSDEPDSEYFYTFNGEMMSDYLKNRSQYSEFTQIVERANMMDILATYGQYTCFVPTNDAVTSYLRRRGLNSIDQLSDEDCDTIARTHLVSNIYSTFQMDQDRLPTANMLGRYLATSTGLDNDNNAVILIEGVAHIDFALKNDSVENGIVHTIDRVIEKSNSYISDILRDDPNISIFYEALIETGVIEQILKVVDADWDPDAFKEFQNRKYYYTSDFWHEVAWIPETRKYGFSAFVEPDEVYRQEFQKRGISTENGELRALYELACQIYDNVYVEDVSSPGHSFENLTDSVNPLKRFIQYHILDRYTSGTADLTPMVMNVGSIHEAFGIDSKLVNPVEWFPTLLPHTMMKIEQLTMDKDAKGNDCRGHDYDKVNERFINRRYASPEYQFRGALIDATVDTTVVHDGLNGHFYYVDDIVAFSRDVRDIVQNMRIRMDFSAIFPEVMTNGLRQEGNPLVDDDSGAADDQSVPPNGRNYVFPMGYIKDLQFSNCYVVLRRPHVNFWSWQGDEWNFFGDYDLTFRIPPVPYSGEWQLRLGFCALPTRGVMQTYFDGVPQGIPLDMTKFLNSELYLGDRISLSKEDKSEYNDMTTEEKAEEQKLLKNLGAYRAGGSLYHFPASGSDKNYFLGNARTYRRILCQTYIDANKDHYLRFRVASDGKQGNNNEFMLDYFEMVPKSVYGVDGTGDMEDDL